MGHDKNINNITIQYKNNKALLYKNLYYILEMHLYKPRSRYSPMKTCAFVTAIKIHIYTHTYIYIYTCTYMLTYTHIHTHHMYTCKYCNNAIRVQERPPRASSRWDRPKLCLNCKRHQGTMLNDTPSTLQILSICNWIKFWVYKNYQYWIQVFYDIMCWVSMSSSCPKQTS